MVVIFKEVEFPPGTVRPGKWVAGRILRYRQLTISSQQIAVARQGRRAWEMPETCLLRLRV